VTNVSPIVCFIYYQSQQATFKTEQKQTVNTISEVFVMTRLRIKHRAQTTSYAYEVLKVEQGSRKKVPIRQNTFSATPRI